MSVWRPAVETTAGPSDDLGPLGVWRPRHALHVGSTRAACGLTSDAWRLESGTMAVYDCRRCVEALRDQVRGSNDAAAQAAGWGA